MGLKNKVADLLGLAKKSTSTAAELQLALESAKADAEAKAAELLAAEEAYAGALVDPDEAASARADEARSAARRASDRVTALVELIETKLADATAREAEAARQARYDAAKTASEKASTELMKIYPKAAAQIREAFMAVARAEAAVQEVNQDLPEGAERLHGPETRLTLTPGVEREDVSADDVELWCINGDRSRVLPADEQRRVRRIEGDRAVYDWPAGPSGLTVIRRKFRKEVFYPHRSPEWTKSPLSIAILPALDGGPDVWNASGQRGADTLRSIAELDRRAEDWAARTPVERQLVTELVPVEDGR